MSNIYYVAAFLNNEYIFQSAHFFNKKDAYSVFKMLTDTNTGDFRFQLYKAYPRGKMTETHTDTDASATSTVQWNITEDVKPAVVLPFTDMTFERYTSRSNTLDGYLLTPTPDFNFSGYNSYHGGFWIKKYHAWFFQLDQYNFLVDGGAEYISEQPQHGGMFYDMTVTDYGKGLLMTCDKSNPLYGTKYLETGFWNATLKGWVFRRDELNYLIEQDAVYMSEVADEDDEDDEDDTPNFESMNFSSYGKGYLLNPMGDSRAGTKYFHNGFWMPSLGGWMFRSEYKQFLIDCGALYIH